MKPFLSKHLTAKRYAILSMITFSLLVFSSYVRSASPPTIYASAISGDLAVKITWSYSDAPQYFVLERKKQSGGDYEVIGSANSNELSFIDSYSLQPNTTYLYRIRLTSDYNTFSNETWACTALATYPHTTPVFSTFYPASYGITLSWSDGNYNEDGFVLERKTGSQSFAAVATIGKNTTSYTDNSLTPSTSYTYRIKAYNASGSSTYSTEKSATTLAPPAPTAPSNLTSIISSGTSIDLAWIDKSTNEDGFRIERMTTGGSYTLIASVSPNVATYKDNTIAANLCYTYRVLAYSAGGQSTPSNEITSCTNAPPAPTSVLIVSNRSNGYPANSISWVNASSSAQGFRIERKKNNEQFAQIAELTGGNITSYSDNSNLDPLTNYTYRIIIYNIFGSASAESTVKTLPAGALAVTSVGNSVVSTTYDAADNVTGQAIVHSDMMGRPIQSQSRDITNRRVMVNQTIYDSYGRAAISTLAAPLSNLNLNYETNFVKNSVGEEYTYKNFEDEPANPAKLYGLLADYYSDGNTIEPYVPASEYPYTRVEYSELNPGVVRKSAMAGKDHRIGSGHESQTYSMPVPENELDHWQTEYFASFKSESNYAYKLETKGITKTITIDADKNTSIVYTAAGGQAISACYADASAPAQTVTAPFSTTCNFIDIHLNVAETVTLSSGTCKVFDLSNDAVVSESFTGAKSFSEGVYRFVYQGTPSSTITLTYNVHYKGHSFNLYDQAGRLLFSFSPEAILKWKAGNVYTEAAAANYATCNKYNSLGWLISSRSPEEGLTNYLYDIDGKIRFSQNALQDTLGRYSYTNYDKVGRAIESGEYTGVFSDDLITNNFKPQGTSATHTTYDEVFPASEIGFGSKTQNFTLGKVSKTWNANCTTYYSYTYDGLVEWIVQKYANGLGTKTIEYIYEDEILRRLAYVIYQQGAADEFVHHYYYDFDGRLTQVKTRKKYAQPIEDESVQARYFYYAHGPLKRVELAGNLQGIDYVYNINGWLKSINSPDLTTATDPGGDGSGGSHPTFGDDLFGMSLDYYSGDYARGSLPITSIPGTQKFNGNIAASRWRNKKFDTTTQSAYQYTYDKRGFLTLANYGTIVSGTNVPSTFKSSGIFNENITGYDLNGNITGLKRYATQCIDDLTYNYNYDGKINQLSSVTDIVDKAVIESDIDNQGASNYKYNQIGQLTDNIAEDQYFTYDVYGHVTAIKKSNGSEIATYTYDDKGFRIKKVAGGTTTWYVRDASGQILATYIENGSTYALSEVNLYGSSRIGQALANTNGSIDKYQYELTDHLGNVRVTFAPSADGVKPTQTLTTAITSNKVVSATNSITLLPGFSTNGHNFLATIDLNATADATTSTVSATDYYPFGMEIPGRIYRSSDAYKFGYQGKYAEKDAETGYNHFEARDYDSRIGRWLVPDPARQYWSSYLGMGNNPVSGVDPDGRWLFGLFGSTSEQRQAARRDAKELNGTVKNWASSKIHVEYDLGTTIFGEPTVIHSKINYRKNGAIDYGSELTNMMMDNFWKLDHPWDPYKSSGLCVPDGSEYFVFGILQASRAFVASRAAAKTGTNSVLTSSEMLRLENAATRIGKPINVVGSRASGTATAASDWDYVIHGLTNREWKMIKNSIPGAPSRIDGLIRNIDVFKGALDVSKPYITIYPKVP